MTPQGLLAEGHAHHRNGLLHEAGRCYRRVLAQEPGHPDALLLLGVLERQAGRVLEAIRWLGEARKVRPDHLDTKVNLAGAFLDAGHPEQARTVLLDEEGVPAREASVLGLLGVASRRLGNQDESETWLRAAVALKPGAAEHWNNLAVTLLETTRYDQALEALEEAVKLRPDHVDALNNLGLALFELGRLGEAESRFRQALKTNPRHAEAHSNLGHLLLSRLDFEAGWVEHEWRLRSRGFTTPLLRSEKPLWDGSPTPLRVLLWAEQGLGEQVLHTTMLGEAATLAPRAIVAVDRRLVGPLQRCHPSLVIVDHEALPHKPPYELHLPLGSLGRIFRPNLDTFSRSPLRTLAPDPGLSDKFTLPERPMSSPGLRVAISWCSPRSRYRSCKDIPLGDMLKALGIPGVVLVNLQYGPVDAEMTEAERSTGITLHSVPGLDRTSDIEGVLSVLTRCDLVVTACNTLAHLAGACGVPTLLIAPAARSILWCWHDISGVSPWYPRVTIVRQADPRSWQDALSACRRFLLAAARGTLQDPHP